jgi:hypothetical protein
MTPSASKTKKEPTVEPGSMDELVRILALGFRYQGVPQGTLVHDLSKAGLTPSRIAQLLCTKPGTVSQQKNEKRPPWPPKKAEEGK